MPSPSVPHDTSIQAYRSKRDFAVTAEPAPSAPGPSENAPIFVVQKHAARRAGLHWDLRLEHGSVLWSWAVRKGPSLDPADRRLAAHVEDHPLDYADFQGTIPEGQYGAGTVETWDRGTWEPIGDPEEAMRKGELQFILHGQRLAGRFRLVRLKRRERERQEVWFLIKGHDEYERPGVDALALEAEIPRLALPPEESAPPEGEASPPPVGLPPAPGAVRAPLPAKQGVELCAAAEQPPAGDQWISEIKFDGYRLLVWIEQGRARLMTRKGHDWTDRLPHLARNFAKISTETALLDGEMVALRENGVSSFHDLQAALSEGGDDRLFFYAFDLLHVNGWDLRDCALIERKQVLAGLSDWTGVVRYSDHVRGQSAAMRRQACEMGLEGIVCKRVDAPYRPGRSDCWLKLKCRGREEFVVLGYTPPAGLRTGFGALQAGYYDKQGQLHYAGGVGTGFTDEELEALRAKLAAIRSDPPAGLLVSGDPLPARITWVRPELVAELQYAGWSGEGRIRHSVFLGLREDKPAQEVVRDPPDPDASRMAYRATAAGPQVISRSIKRKVVPSLPSGPPAPAVPGPPAGVIVARAPKRKTKTVSGVELTHADRQLWPGITKLDLAEYWQVVAARALPGIGHRPLGIVRCPEGIGGERFFQKRTEGLFPPFVRDGSAAGSPYVAVDDTDGLIAMAQMSAIELHAWGASEADPLHPDWLVFDLDPAQDVGWVDVIVAAHHLRDRLERMGLVSFCRTTGGKGLHLVAPVIPDPEWDWERVKTFCRAFAEMICEADPGRYICTVSKAQRQGRILVDWIRNAIGNTAIASFCPRARPGAPVATPLAWDEVVPQLDPAAFTLRTVPDRIDKLGDDPWRGFFETKQSIPDFGARHNRSDEDRPSDANRRRSSAVVYAPKPRSRRTP
ncbi:MAG: DNA ligase D [Acetobacteraceae bacterium]|nr:DNA ligase D [Acetobacteraceae bacterium]